MVFQHILEFSKTGATPTFSSEQTSESNDFIATLIELTVSNESRNEGVRERVAIELINAEHLTEKRGGWDGRKGRKMVEVKSESQGTKGLSGKGRFNQLTWDSFRKYQEDEGYYIAISFNEHGHIIYALAFEMNHLLPKMESLLIEKIGTRDQVGKKEKNVNVCISHTDFPEKFEVLFLSKQLDPDWFVGKFGKKIMDNYYNNTKLNKVRLTAKPRPKHKKTKKKASVKKVAFIDKVYACYNTTDFVISEGKVTFFKNGREKTVLVKSVHNLYSRKKAQV